MSQVSTSRAARSSRSSARRPQPGRQLRVVPGVTGARISWFPVLCVGLLASGLIGVLLLNTSLAEGAFQLDKLQATSSVLADRQESLTHTLEEQRSPQHLARRALSLGMVPADSAAFLRLSDGAILGVAKPATRSEGFTVATALGGGGAASAGATKPASSSASSGAPGATPSSSPSPTTAAKAATTTSTTSTSSATAPSGSGSGSPTPATTGASSPPTPSPSSTQAPTSTGGN